MILSHKKGINGLTTLLLYVCCGILQGVQAQEPLRLTLADCLQKALAHSAEVSKANLDKTALAYKEKEQRQAVLPRLNTFIDLSAAPIRETQILEGTNLAVSDAQIPVQFGRTWNLQLGLTVQQLIFDEKLRRSVPAAKLGRQLAAQAITKSENTVLNQTAQLYFSILKTEALLETIAANDKKLLRLEETAQLLVSNELGTSLDAKRIQVARANLKAKLQKLEAAIDYQKDLLAAFCGMELEGTDLELAKSETPLFLQIPTKAPAPEEKLLNGAMELTKIQINASKATLFPTLGAYASASVQAPRNDVNFVDPDGRWYGAMLIGLRAQSPLFDGSKHKVRALEVEMRKHEENLRQFRTLQAVEQRNADKQLAAAKVNLNVLKQNVQLAEEIQTQLELQYKEGYTTLSEVLNAQTAVVEAETNLKQQEIEVRLAELKVLHIRGQLDLLL